MKSFLLPFLCALALSPAGFADMEVQLSSSEFFRARVLGMEDGMLQVHPSWADAPVRIPLEEVALLTRIRSTISHNGETPRHTLVFHGGDELSGLLTGLDEHHAVLETPWGQTASVPVSLLRNIRMIPAQANVLISDLTVPTLYDERRLHRSMQPQGFVAVGGELLPSTEHRARAFLLLPVIEGSFSLEFRMRFPEDFSNYNLTFFAPPRGFLPGEGGFQLHSYGRNLRINRRGNTIHGGMGGDMWQGESEKEPGRVHELRLVFEEDTSRMRLYRNQMLIRDWRLPMGHDALVFHQITGLNLTMNSTPPPVVDRLKLIAYPGLPPATLPPPAAGDPIRIALQNGDEMKVKSIGLQEGHLQIQTDSGVEMRLPPDLISMIQFPAGEEPAYEAASEIRLGAARTRLTVRVQDIDANGIRVARPEIEPVLVIPWNAIDLLDVNPETL